MVGLTINKWTYGLISCFVNKILPIAAIDPFVILDVKWTMPIKL
jgi:hypothetical protein